VIRGAYNKEVNPPAPFVLVHLAHPVDGTRLVDIPAQVDTAAFRTVVSLSHLQSLDVRRIDEIVAAGLGGN
jgi:hypothetical protein